MVFLGGWVFLMSEAPSYGDVTRNRVADAARWPGVQGLGVVFEG